MTETPSIREIHGLRYRDGTVDSIVDPVVVEDLITLYFNGKKYLTLVATNDSLTELGAGFFIAAGVASSISSVRVDGLSIHVEGTERQAETLCMESSGGWCSPSTAPAAIPVVPGIITPDEIFRIRESLNDDAWTQTGGLHCTALFHDHAVVKQFSDIGRHNTVDKAIGYMVLHGYDPADCVIGSTGREPFGMVQKAVNAKIPVIVSRAAATTAGIDLADRSGITLLCFTRDRRFTVYTHPERVRFA
ncbi:MAG TPA: formate dehydrogenase accessory sulfurtransferase FdhD [Methanocorpusculum sp.]|nr:formate dehydrogenase accessory sulfurtransferase FdhD [Methanocorpusculum sp.]